MKKQYLIIGGLILVAIAVAVWFSGSEMGGTDKNVAQQPEEDPVDVVLGFYKPWLAAVQDEAVNPFESELATASVLSESARTYIADSQNSEMTVEPVLCQSLTPGKVRAKVSFVQTQKAEVLVLGRGLEQKSSEQAVVGLIAVDGQWQIESITCVSGESAPEREFTFDREGFLFKNAKPPLNPDYWYLVFEENGEPGHTAPLFFDGDSTCLTQSGTESVCDAGTLPNATKAWVKAQMTESGAQVMHLEILE